MVAVTRGESGRRERGTPVRAGAGARGAGFTLIELLVAISIIAVLIGILLPTLGGARNTAKSAKCLSNQHQIGIAFATYTSELGHYPTQISYERGPDGRMHRLLNQALVSWGGVDFHEEGDDSTDYFHRQERLVNPYIGSNLHERGRAEVFLCPGDNGLISTADGSRRPVNEVAPQSSSDEDRNETVFGAVGTSYRANDWLWAPVGRLWGWYNRQLPSVFALNRPEFAFSPSRFVLTIDYAGSKIVRASEESYRVGFGIHWTGIEYAWWHSKDSANAVFQDGSARKIAKSPGNAATSEFSFWLDERRHQPNSFVLTPSWEGTPRARMPSGPWTQ